MWCPDPNSLVERCTRLRCLPPELRHRCIFQLAFFIMEMEHWLVFNKYSLNEELREFQWSLERDGLKKLLDPEDFCTYLTLFDMWLTEMEQGFTGCYETLL